MGEADQMQALLVQVLSTARQARMDPTLVLALRVQVLEEALTLCRGMATPYTEAKTLYVAGLVSRNRKEWAPARQRFER